MTFGDKSVHTPTFFSCSLFATFPDSKWLPFLLFFLFFVVSSTSKVFTGRFSQLKGKPKSRGRKSHSLESKTGRGYMWYRTKKQRETKQHRIMAPESHTIHSLDRFYNLTACLGATVDMERADGGGSTEFEPPGEQALLAQCRLFN